MKSIRLQHGFTMWETSIYVFVFLFIVTIALKLGPLYIDDMNVAKALEGVHADLMGQDIYEVTNSDIKQRIGKYFEVSMVSNDRLKDIQIDRKGGKVIVRIDYDVRSSFMGNVDIIVHFPHEVDLAEPVKK
jgi:hypothetical protein